MPRAQLLSTAAMPAEAPVPEAPTATLNGKKYLLPQQASEFLAGIGLPLARASLDTMVTRGGGPAYFKWGSRRLYEEGDLIAWAAARLGKSRASSSEAA